tara:strand:- start:1189 stop:1527 length:339 start_codon:yes stop_codon:yes gene_type:complete
VNGCADLRTVGPAVHHDGPGPAPPIGISPVAGQPGAPASGWRCGAGHEGWIVSHECTVDLADFATLDDFAAWIEARAGHDGRGALAAADGADPLGSSHRTGALDRGRRGGNN